MWIIKNSEVDINEKSSWWDAGVCSSTVLHTGHLINARTGPGDEKRKEKHLRARSACSCPVESLVSQAGKAPCMLPGGAAGYVNADPSYCSPRDWTYHPKHSTHNQLLNIHLSLCLSPEIPINFWNCSSYVFPPLFHKHTHTHMLSLLLFLLWCSSHRLSVWVSIQRMIPNGYLTKVESKEGWGIQRKINTLGQWVFLW